MRREEKTLWDEDLDQALMKAIVDGDSYLTISKRFRTTRTAIAGRCFRLRKRGHVFEGPGHAIQTAYGNKNRTYRPSEKETIMGHKTKTSEEERGRDKTTGRLVPVKGNKVVRLDNSPEPITILELSAGQCKAAVGDEPRKGFGVIQPFVFCGAPTEEGEVYCTEHGRQMYQRPKTRAPGDGGRGMVLERLGISRGS